MVVAAIVIEMRLNCCFLSIINQKNNNWNVTNRACACVFIYVRTCVFLCFCPVNLVFQCSYFILYHILSWNYYFFQVQASLTMTLLQSDIKTALKTAFSSIDGPLLVTDWCRGRSQSSDGIMGDGFSAESTASASECRDSSSTVTLSVGESMSPSLSSADGLSCLKGIIIIFIFSNPMRF